MWLFKIDIHLYNRIQHTILSRKTDYKGIYAIYEEKDVHIDDPQWSREIDLVISLLYHHGELRLDLQYSCKRLYWQGLPVIPGLWTQEQSDPAAAGLPFSHSGQLVSSSYSE